MILFVSGAWGWKMVLHNVFCIEKSLQLISTVHVPRVHGWWNICWCLGFQLKVHCGLNSIVSLMKGSRWVVVTRALGWCHRDQIPVGYSLVVQCATRISPAPFIASFYHFTAATLKAPDVYMRGCCLRSELYLVHAFDKKSPLPRLLRVTA